MCGIVAYIGKGTKDILINGLKRLEYRDSSVVFHYLKEMN